MDLAADPARRARADPRYRYRTHTGSRNNELQLEPKGNKERPSPVVRNRRWRGRDTMTKDHRLFHRRAAQAAPRVVTVNVEVVAIVDTNGHTIAEETKPPQTPSPTLPTTTGAAAVAAASAAPIVAVSIPTVEPVPPVPSASSASSAPTPPSQLAPSALPVPKPPIEPAVPTVAAPALPSVPAVPPFPSDLVVPSVVAYPWPSGVPVAQAVGSSSSAAVMPAPSSVTQSSGASAPAPTISLSSNSTSFLSTPSSVSSAISFLSMDSVSALSQLSSSLIPVSSDRPSASRSTTGVPLGSSSTTSDSATSTYYGGGVSGGLGSPASSAALPTAATTAASADDDTASAPLETPQVVGSVVGSIAGAAFILAIILILLRRHKRSKRGGALQLTGDEHNADHEQPMRQASTRNSVVPISFLKRFSGMSRSTAETTLSGGDRSFQRVSGRKLPSAFSEGMTSDQFSRGGTMSESSFYQDDHGVYGGPGMAKEFGKEIGDTHATRESGKMNIRPGPARTPIIRHPDEDPFTDKTHLSPPQSPNLGSPGRGTLGRSLHSADGSRSSRFTENV